MAAAVLQPLRPALDHDQTRRSSHTKTLSTDHLLPRLSLFKSNSRSHSSPADSEAATEQEYDRLRTLSQSEQDQCHSCFQRSTSAYHRGDHAAAHELSERGKEHGRQADMYARQASEYIFTQLNRPGLVDEDTVDLHGQYVSEAEEILERELKDARRRGRKGLTVIVGRGNHSADRISKLKPCVENICRKHHLHYSTEEHNQGRIFIDLVSGGGSGNSNRVNGYHGVSQHNTTEVTPTTTTTTTTTTSTTHSEKVDHHHHHHHQGHAASTPEKEIRKKIADWKRLNCFGCVVM